MKFTMFRNRTLCSTSGLAIEFVKGVPTEVPASMHEEVLSAGGVPESELDLDPKTKDNDEPVDPAERQKALFAAFETMLLRSKREDFTASGAPHGKALAVLLGWTVGNKERDTAWQAYQQKAD